MLSKSRNILVPRLRVWGDWVSGLRDRDRVLTTPVFFSGKWPFLNRHLVYDKMTGEHCENGWKRRPKPRKNARENGCKCKMLQGQIGFFAEKMRKKSKKIRKNPEKRLESLEQKSRCFETAKVPSLRDRDRDRDNTIHDMSFWKNLGPFLKTPGPSDDTLRLNSKL